MKTIVFDFGNVLGFFDHRLTLNRLAAHTDMSVAEMYQAIYRTALEDDFESGRITTAEFIGQVRQLCRVDCTDQQIAEAFCDIFQPNQDLCNLVPALKTRYQLMLGSNTNELHAGHFCRQFADTLAHFENLVLSYQIGVRKPRADFFQHCQRLAHGRPEECVFIDDLPDNVAAARQHGWQGILYHDFDDLRSRLAALAIV